MPGSKNLKVFGNWFAMDSLSQDQETALCLKMGQAAGDPKGWDWGSDQKSFWLPERSHYYTHRCDTCKKSFNYPVEISACPVCDSKISSKSVWLGRIEPPSEKEWSNSMNKIPVADPGLLQRAQEELAENPVKEEGFDWQHLRDNL